jgi:hypothetical protein
MNEDSQALARIYDYLELEVKVDVSHNASIQVVDALISSHRRLVEELAAYRAQATEEDKNLRRIIMEKYIKNNDFISKKELSHMTISEINSLLEWYE